MNPLQPELLANFHCETGENPYWVEEDATVLWTDIPAGKLFRYDPANGQSETIYSGPPVGGFTRQADGNLLLFRVEDLAIMSPRGQVSPLLPYSDEGMARFNDVIADPEGRVFAGTIGRSTTSGGLYRVDRDGTVTKLFEGTGVSNGMGFSPGLDTFYWTCSTTRRIFAFAYDRAKGELSARRVLYEASPEEGTPDGLAVDTEGDLWSARWDGAALIRHASDGTVKEKISFPVAKVTSAAFGGSAYGDLYVTTAGGAPESESEDGALFRLRPPATGRAEFPSRILL